MNRIWTAWLLALLLTVGSACRGGEQARQETETATQPKAVAGADEEGCGRVEDGQRLVSHAMGESRVPLEPQRVVVLDTGELDSAIALGFKPVGAVTATQGGPYPAYLLDRTEGVRTVGTIAQPNLEAIAALQPDLILSNKTRHEAIFPQLSGIAPTVFTETVGVAWKENLPVHAEALGRCKEAAELLAAYHERLEVFRRAMGDRLGATTVSVVRSMPNQVRIMMKASFIGTILEDAGLPRPPAQDKEVFMEQATLERVPDLDGAVLFLTRFGGDHSRLGQLQASPLWNQLSVVRSGRVYEVPDDRWMLGIGIVAANEVVDDLFGYLLT